MNPYYSVNLTMEAYDRLCDIQDYLNKLLGSDDEYSLDEICSIVLCQMELRGIDYL